LAQFSGEVRCKQGADMVRRRFVGRRASSVFVAAALIAGSVVIGHDADVPAAATPDRIDFVGAGSNSGSPDVLVPAGTAAGDFGTVVGWWRVNARVRL
jgi:hypothetical protein